MDSIFIYSSGTWRCRNDFFTSSENGRLMELTPREKDKLLIFTAGLVANGAWPAGSNSITRRPLR
jgi:hypothetical protein